MGRIFEKLKIQKEYDYKLGKEELEYIYLSENLPIIEQLELAEYLIEEIIYMYNEDIICPKFHLEDVPLVYYINPLLNKINILIMENIIEESWIEGLTKNLIYNGENPWEVKLGLILSSRYISDERLPEIMDVFVKSGEYIFYLMNTVRNLKGYNNYLVELSRKTKGTIRVFAITNIEYFSLETISYIIEEGYKDEIYEDLLIDYIFTTINISKYLEKGIGKDRLDNLSYLISNYLRKNKFSTFMAKYDLIEKYLSLVSNMGDNFENLNSMILIREGIIQNDDLEFDVDQLEKAINNLLEDKKWLDVFETAIKEGKGLSEDIITLADFYDYQLEFKDLLQYLKRDRKDINIYCYITEEGSKQDKLMLLNFFKDNFNINGFCEYAQDIDDKDLKKEDIIYIIFAIIVKSLREIYPHGKGIAIKALTGKINKIRNESIKYISRYRDQINDKELAEIKYAYDSEPNDEIKLKIETLLCSYEDGKKEYVDVEALATYEHVGDIYLITTEVSGCQFRNRRILEEELENSKTFFLQLDENNLYDDRAIKAVGESGFVIGFISRKDNFILSNLLKGGKYLYCKVEKYNLENNSISIRVYLSYKDVIDSINDTILMLHGNNTGGFIN